MKRLSQTTGCHTWRRFIEAASIVLILTVASPLWADAGLSREQAIAAALDRVGGASKVLGVKKQVSNSGAEEFAVKLMVNGRVKVVRIPATGGSN
ncbi:MAG: hypothetical protein KTR35_06120 [Gammaproteobacteria bacterium]|nr:hypothetical protein [Gammaproteobacteria bacterium]